MLNSAANKLCTLVATTGDISPGSVKLATWLIGVARLQKRRHLQISLREIQEGIRVDGDTKVPGTRMHRLSIKQALEDLEEQGIVTVRPGDTHSGGAFTYPVIEVLE